MQATQKIWMDGQFVDWDKAQVHVLSHTLHYGLGVFEGIRCYDTAHGPAIFRLQEHTERLFHSAHIAGMQMTWTLRPYVVRPRTEDVPFLRAREGSFLDSVSRSIDSARGIYYRGEAPLPGDFSSR